MKTAIIKATIFGVLAGFLGFVLVSAQPSEYGIAITPALLAAGMVLVMTAELLETMPKEKSLYGLIFHSSTALTLFVLVWSHGMLGGYEYDFWGYHTDTTIETVRVAGWQWMLLFGVYLVRVCIEISIWLTDKLGLQERS